MKFENGEKVKVMVEHIGLLWKKKDINAWPKGREYASPKNYTLRCGTILEVIGYKEITNSSVKYDMVILKIDDISHVCVPEFKLMPVK